MMMVYDSSRPPPSRLDDATIDLLRTALGDYLKDDSIGSGLRRALRDVAVEAREKAILPEHLLIVLKDVWNALPDVRGTPDASEQIRMLQRVVTMCIAEYYRG